MEEPPSQQGLLLINIGGLAVGMTVALLNGLWILDEFSYNKSFTNYDRIAQVSEMGYDSQREDNGSHDHDLPAEYRID